MLELKLSQNCRSVLMKDDKSFKRDIIFFISFPMLLVSTSFLVNIGKEMFLLGFRTYGLGRVGLYMYVQHARMAKTKLIAHLIHPSLHNVYD